jgi:death-on-curing protein
MAWRWLREDVIIAVHGEQITEHAGSAGIRDAGLLSSAFARPRHRATYGEPSVFDLAAAYAFGILGNHPFIDGNKRTGFLAAYTFLYINGWELTASEVEAVTAPLALAAGGTDEAEFSNWLEKESTSLQKS